MTAQRRDQAQRARTSPSIYAAMERFGYRVLRLVDDGSQYHERQIPFLSDGSDRGTFHVHRQRSETMVGRRLGRSRQQRR